MPVERLDVLCAKKYIDFRLPQNINRRFALKGTGSVQSVEIADPLCRLEDENRILSLLPPGYTLYEDTDKVYFDWVEKRIEIKKKWRYDHLKH